MLWIISFCTGIFLLCLGIFGLTWAALRQKGGRWEIPTQDILAWLSMPGWWGGRRWLAWILTGIFLAGGPLLVFF